jgi:hypothetical protein
MRQPTYAGVVATIALVLAASGGAYAATQLPSNSVGAKQVKDHSLTAKEFKAGQLGTASTGSAGPAGPAGPAGQAGPAGPAGPAVGTSGYLDQMAIRSYGTNCLDTSFDGDDFTVATPTVLWASGSVLFAPKGPAAQEHHREFARVTLLAGGLSIADSGWAATASNGPTGIDATGTVHGQGGHAYVLQPGTTYTLRLDVVTTATGSCSDTAELSRLRLDWLGFAAAG